MAELAETRPVPDGSRVAPDYVARAARGDLEPLPAATVDTADCRPGGYEHPRSHMYHTYRSKHVPTSFAKHSKIVQVVMM